MNSYEAKQEARRARLETAAANATEQAEFRFQTARAAVDGIPFGQPILVGHHSERRHRAAVDKMARNMDKGCALTKEAEELARRAAAVGTGGISSDDPDAIDKLDDKRTELERRRDDMKAANAFYKKHGTLEGCDAPADVIADGLTTLRVQPYYRVPFPPYALQNIGARIRDAVKRAERIEAVASLTASVETIGLATITLDPTENRVLLVFPAKLSKADYKLVRSGGFVWSPTRGAFVRKISSAAVYHARELAKRITTTEG